MGCLDGQSGLGSIIIESDCVPVWPTARGTVKALTLCTQVAYYGGEYMATRSSGNLVTVLDPRGQPTNVVEPKPLAPRLDTLDGKTIHLIDVGFGGGWEFLEETVAWFARNMPSVKTVLKHKSGIMFVDEPQMWVDAKANAHAVIFGVGG